MASVMPLLALLLVSSLPGAVGMRKKKNSWGSSAIAGSYCCYTVDPVTKVRFAARNFGLSHTNDILKCDVVAQRACPFSIEKDGSSSFHSTPNGTRADFLDQAKLWDDTMGTAKSEVKKDDMSKTKASLHIHVKKNIGDYYQTESERIQDEYKNRLSRRLETAEGLYKENMEQLNAAHSSEVKDTFEHHQAEKAAFIAAQKKELDAKTSDATIALHENTGKAQVVYDDTIREADSTLAGAKAGEQHKFDETFRDATDNFEAKANEAALHATSEFKKVYNDLVAKHKENSDAEFELQQNTIKEAGEQEAQWRDKELKPVVTLHKHATEDWSVPKDIEDLYEKRSKECEGGDEDTCCCLSQLGSTSEFQAFKVPKNFALATCKEVAPYYGGFMGYRSCPYFVNCGVCMEKLCDAGKHCGAAPVE